jgi:4-hydroxy-tetrahydrodipicolinate synthase
MSNEKYRGIIPPILTPFTPDEKVDRASLKKLVNYMIDNGIHGIWATGTTGEFATMKDKERVIALEAITEAANGRIPVIACIADASTERTVDMGAAIKHIGVDAVAATPPYYFPNSPDEMLDHYRYIREKVDLPLFIYSIPQTVKVAVPPAVTAELAKEGTVIGIKDSSGAGELLADLVMRCEKENIDLRIVLGTRIRIATCKRVGVHGAVAGTANVMPEATVKAWEAGERDDMVEAIKWDNKLDLLAKLPALAKGGSPMAANLAGMKAALKAMGIIDHDTVTRPLRPLSEEEKKGIPAILKEMGLPVAAGVK